MTTWRAQEPEQIPERLEWFQAFAWVRDVDAVSADYDVWTPTRFFIRPRTSDPQILDAYERFRAERAEWLRLHPEWVQQQVDEMVDRRARRRWAQTEAWVDRLEAEVKNPNPRG